MAIYKRYNSRRKKVNRALIIWIAAMVVIFGATVILGNHLRNKAANPDILQIEGVGGDAGNDVATPIAERIMRGEYVDGKDLSSFVPDDPFVYASTWIYRDGKPFFATQTDEKLAISAEGLTPLTSFSSGAASTGLFEVRSVYADATVRSIIAEYELSLLRDFSASALGETVLVFNEISIDNMNDIFAFAARAKATAVCLPYSLLYDENSARIFAAVSDGGYTLALRVSGITGEQLADDIESYAFYFTKYNIRLVLEGADEKLVDVLAEKSALNYQFCSKRPEASVPETEPKSGDDTR